MSMEIVLLSGTSAAKPPHDPRKSAHIGPPLPAVVGRLVWIVSPRRVTPAQPVEIDKDNVAQDASVIDAWQTTALQEIRL